MPEVVAVSGAAPHYTPPRLDGGRPGTFWFNTERPTAGTGWDIEVVAFHEAVPGHHLQLSRLQLLTDLPALQRQRSLPVFSEGWGLYAEELAEEAGLYADDRGLLGSVSTSLMRAARLVVDTGLHFYGWSREQALEFWTTARCRCRPWPAASQTGWTGPTDCHRPALPGRLIRRASSSTKAGSAKNESRYVRRWRRTGPGWRITAARRRAGLTWRITAARRRGRATSH